jgi:hypothetical protein
MPEPNSRTLVQGSTFVICAHPAAVGGRTITCTCCGRTSSHPRDVEERYCAACHHFHEEALAAEEPTP